MEWNDIYDAAGRPTGRKHLRGTPWGRGEYGLTVCVWVYDGEGKLLLTRRAPEKSFAGTWENSGGAAQTGETSRQAIARELFEETGIQADPEEFEFICADRDDHSHYHHYALKRQTPLEQIVLLPGETDAARWVTRGQIHKMIRRGQICKIIAEQFIAQEPELIRREQHTQP